MTGPGARLGRRALLVLLAGTSSTAFAQGRPAPFETTDLTLTVLADVGSGTLHRFWSPGPAVAAGLAFPFYLGRVEAGAQYAHPDASSGDVPGFRSLFLYAGWAAEHDLARRWQAGAGLRVGLMAMRFDGDTIPASRRRESELGTAARVNLRWQPRGPWLTEAAVTYQSILTHHRMEQIFLSVGLGRRFTTPGWLRDFLD